MKKHQYRNTGLFICVAVLIASMQICVADMAEASASLASVSVVSTQANMELAKAAISGDVKMISDAQKRVAAVDSATREAQEAYAAMERAVANGDGASAADAADDLEAACQKADDALNGAVPEPSAESLNEQWKESTTNTGGGPGQAYDPPNIYHVPWQSAGIQSLYSSLFSSVFSASGGTSANSNSLGDSDKDVTEI